MPGLARAHVKWRRIPPALSPVPPLAFLRAAGLLATGRDPRRRLAKVLASLHRAERVVVTDSGTSALMLAMRYALDRPGSRRIVALPAFACFDLATAAVGAGARVALYDVDPATYGPDLESLGRVAALDPAAIVVAPPFGLVPDWAPIRELAGRAGAVLINDAAQSQGARLAGGTAASAAPLAVLSFGRGKGWTGGAGGALLVRGEATSWVPDEPLAAPRINAGMSAIARTAVLAAATHPLVYPVPGMLPWLRLGETHYREPTEPRAMPRATAALILATHSASEAAAEQRLRLAASYADGIGDDPGIQTPGSAAGAVTGYLRFPIRAPANYASHLLRTGGRLGIAPTWPHTLAELPAIQTRRVDSEPLEVATALCREVVTLPTHRFVNDHDRHRIRRLVLDHRGARRSSIIIPARSSAR